MNERKAKGTWEGTLKSGNGHVWVQKNTHEMPYSFGSRFEKGQGTSPEELIAAAHAGCYSMALSHVLELAGYQPEFVQTKASVQLDKSANEFSISRVSLQTEARVPELSADEFQRLSAKANRSCIVSKLIGGHAEISLNAKLNGTAG